MSDPDLRLTDDAELTTHQVARILRVSTGTVRNYELRGKITLVGSRAVPRGRPTNLYDAESVYRCRAELAMDAAKRAPSVNQWTFEITEAPFAVGIAPAGVLQRRFIRAVESSAHDEYLILLPPWSEAEWYLADRWLRVGFKIRVDGALGEDRKISASGVAVDVASMVEYALSLQTPSS